MKEKREPLPEMTPALIVGWGCKCLNRPLTGKCTPITSHDASK